ncbi:TrfB-related DNA-binding protein [Pseudomonas helleri]|uniref:TrfB-related DNA-binding protein n=1 Tax=Pseudomonas helleri TaxID=1608996 RepID=UPI003FD2C477
MSNTLISNKAPTLTAEQLIRLKLDLQSGISGNTWAIVEAVCVRGLTKAEAARELGTSPQNVSGAISRITAHLNGFPPDWTLVQEWMPKEMATGVRKELKRLKAELASAKSKRNK